MSSADVRASFGSRPRKRSGLEPVGTYAVLRFRRRCRLGARLDDDANPPFMVVVATRDSFCALQAQLAPGSVLLARSRLHVHIE